MWATVFKELAKFWRSFVSFAHRSFLRTFGLADNSVLRYRIFTQFWKFGAFSQISE